MSKYTVLGRAFRTKTELQDYIRSIVARYEDGSPLTGADHDFILSLLDLHQERDDKVGCGVKTITVESNYIHGKRTRGFWITRLDGSRTDFSWTKCLSPATHEQDVRKAFRDEIGDQIREYKLATLSSGPVSCPYTGQRLSIRNAHADHAVPDTFLDLLGRFLAAEGLSYESVGVAKTTDGEVYNRLTDDGMRARWRDFHLKNARLRLLSRKGNLSHAKRGLAPGSDAHPH